MIDDDDDDQLFIFMEYVELGPVMRHDSNNNTFFSTVTGGICDAELAGTYLLDIASGSSTVPHRSIFFCENLKLSQIENLKMIGFHALKVIGSYAATQKNGSCILL